MCKAHYPGVAQLVGRLVWDQDAASSSLATRTKKAGMTCSHSCFFILNVGLEPFIASVHWTLAALLLGGKHTLRYAKGITATSDLAFFFLCA